MSNLEAQAPKLNVFALPSQTTVIFAGILVVIAAPLLYSLTSLRFFITAPFLPLVVLLFTVWDFLAEPLRMQARFHAQPLPPSAQTLELHIYRLSHDVGLAHPPVVLQTLEPLTTPVTFGTWRRRFLLLPAWALEEFTRVLENPDDPNRNHVDVVLRHELAHIVNQDVWLTMFARSLLKITVLTLLAYWFAQLWVPIVYVSGIQTIPELKRLAPPFLLAKLPEQVQEIVRNPPIPNSSFAYINGLEVSMTLLPIVAGAVVLWLRDWPLLLRVRELYVDARVETWLRDPKLIEDTLHWFPTVRVALRTTGQQESSTHERPLQRVRARLSGLRQPQPLSWPVANEISKTLMPGPHPTKTTRRQALRRPETIAGDAPAIGRRVGVLILLIFIMNASLLSPTAQQGIGSAVPLGVGLIFLALGLAPAVIAHLPDHRVVVDQARSAILRFVLVFALPLCLVILAEVGVVIFHPEWLQLVFYGAAGVSPATLLAVVDDPLSYMVQALAGAMLVYLVATPLLLAFFLRLDVWLKQRVLGWYGAERVRRRPQSVLLAVTLSLGAFLFWGVSPVIELIAFPFILTPDVRTLIPVAVCWLLAGLASLLFWRVDRRLHGLCGRCGQSTRMPFQLGAVCPHCGSELRPEFRKEIP
jgi:Zn-dependent protease with chaperone function